MLLAMDPVCHLVVVTESRLVPINFIVKNGGTIYAQGLVAFRFYGVQSISASAKLHISAKSICYCAHVRTTLDIDDLLYRRAKATAAERGCSVTSVIEEALRSALDAKVLDAPLQPLPVASESGGTLPGVDLYDARALAAILDENRV